MSSNALSENLIIPKKKPEISSEKKVISELKNEIFPLKKPSLNKKTEANVKNKDKTKNISGIILPENKPLVIAKKRLKKKTKK